MKYNIYLLYIILCASMSTLMAEIIIVPIQSHHIQAARSIILNAVWELQIVPTTTKTELELLLLTTGELEDLNNLQTVYFNNNGIFLVMLDQDKVVGMGAIKKFDHYTCELKRMFFDKAYRGKGLGKKMAQKLIEQAKELGYKKVVLDVYNPATQLSAIALYKKLGFYEIAPYKNSKAKLFMEKILGS